MMFPIIVCIHDMGTNDFIIGLMEKHEKMAWMLRAPRKRN
jgi:starvation-inducible DNA-binding protein